CRSGSSGVAISLTLQPSAGQNMDLGQSLSFMATVRNDTTNSGVVWEIYNNKTTVPVSCTLPSCGTLSNTTPFNVTYTAPTGLLGSNQVTLQATARALTSVISTVTITIVQPPVINTTALPSGQNGVAYSQ